MLLEPADVQVARHYYSIRDSLARSTTTRAPKQSGKRKVARAERNPAFARQTLIKSGEFAEYDLRVVSRRTVLDPDRTPDMEANELRLWDKCAACRKELGPSVYRFYLAKRIERLEIMACSGSSCELHAHRRLVALLAQERIMLDMENTELKTAGFDGAFIALGRIVRARGFKAEMGWYTEDELRAHRAAKDTATKSEHLPETGNA